MVPSRALLREPLLWAVIAAYVGAAVGLAGTSRMAAWLGDSYGSAGRPPVLALLAAPLGELLVALSLLGVLPFLGGGPRAAARVARLLGVPLVLLVLLFLPLFLAFELGWISFGKATPYGGPPPLLMAFFALDLCLPSVVVVPFALAAFLRRRMGLGAILLGLCVLAVPSLLVWQIASDGYVGEIPQDAATIVLLGGLGVGVGLPETLLWVLFGTVLFRGARERARGEEFRAQEKVNARAARRLYEEGLGEGDASVVDDLVSEDFRDLKSGARGRLGMERVFSGLRRSYPDLSVSVEGQEAEGDLVRTRLLLSGTDEGGAMWYPPTGRRVSFTAEFADRFWGGLVVEHSGEADTAELLRQLGHPAKRHEDNPPLEL